MACVDRLEAVYSSEYVYKSVVAVPRARMHAVAAALVELDHDVGDAADLWLDARKRVCVLDEDALCPLLVSLMPSSASHAFVYSAGAGADLLAARGMRVTVLNDPSPARS